MTRQKCPWKEVSSSKGNSDQKFKIDWPIDEKKEIEKVENRRSETTLINRQLHANNEEGTEGGITMEFIIQEAAGHLVMHIDDIYTLCDIF